MLEGITERVRKVSEGVFASGSRAGAPQEGAVSTTQPPENDLLIPVIILIIIVVALLLVIIYGYCKFVRKKNMEGERRERSKNMREATGDAGLPPLDDAITPPDTPPHLNVPVKMRKRSMTFSETDEECRKYREDLADAFDKQPETVKSAERSRKKSVVTFAGVEVIDANES